MDETFVNSLMIHYESIISQPALFTGDPMQEKALITSAPTQSGLMRCNFMNNYGYQKFIGDLVCVSRLEEKDFRAINLVHFRVKT
jgi:hypothetical protein